jgi:hypothetical protein
MAVLGLFSANAMAAHAANEVPRWKVAGAFLPTGAENEKAFTATSTGAIELEGGGLHLTSTSCEAVEGKIQGTAAGTAGTNTEKLRCKGVVVVGFSAVCEANSPGEAEGTITTNPLKSTLVYLTKNSSKSGGVLFKPATGSEFVNIHVGGAEEECPLEGNYPVTRSIVGKFLQEGGTEFEEGQLEFPTTAITTYYTGTEAAASTVEGIEIKANPAKFTGKFNLKLNPKEKVGVFPG